MAHLLHLKSLLFPLQITSNQKKWLHFGWVYLEPVERLSAGFSQPFTSV